MSNSRVYAECSGAEPEGTMGQAGHQGDGLGSRAEFLSAQRLEDGRRTFKMVQHAPELTSFGLDLYDKIIPAGNMKI